MARKNQDDIWCFEADTFRHELIDNLQIDSTRVPLSSKKKKKTPKPHTLFEDQVVWQLQKLSAVRSKGKGL